MQVIAHRGVHRLHPENTLAAFAAAVELGIPAIETDLRLAADGQVVLFHDRTAGGRLVEQLTRDELSRQVGYPVPTLAEALSAVPRAQWILELKTPQVLTPSLTLLDSFVDSHQLLLISFWHAMIIDAAERTKVGLGFSLGHTPIGFLEAAHAARRRSPHIGTLVWNYEFLDVNVLQRARATAWRNLVFNTLVDADDVRCETLQIDGVITDRPDGSTLTTHSLSTRDHH